MQPIETYKNEDRCDIRSIHKERINAARRDMLPVGETDSMAALFKAMGDPSRLKILWALEKGEMCVCDMAALLECSESATSHQLRLLRQMALVCNRRQGQVLYYRLNDDHVYQFMHIALEHVRE